MSVAIWWKSACPLAVEPRDDAGARELSQRWLDQVEDPRLVARRSDHQRGARRLAARDGLERRQWQKRAVRDRAEADSRLRVQQVLERDTAELRRRASRAPARAGMQRAA